MRGPCLWHKAVWPLVFSLWLVPLCLQGCGLFDDEGDGVALVIGSRRLTLHELRRDMAFLGADLDIPEEERAQFRAQMIDRIIDRYLILEYGRQEGISVSDMELEKTIAEIRGQYMEGEFRKALLHGDMDYDQWKERLREQCLMRKIFERITADISVPSYKEVKEYFEANQQAFRHPRMVKFRQIVTRTRGEAEKLLSQLRQGKDMAQLAAKYSIAPEAANGGLVGWIAKGDLDESMDNVLFSMEVGSISPVIKTPYGYHIFKVLSVRPEGVRTLPAVVSEIETKLLNEKRQAYCKRWLSLLRSKTNIKLNQEVLKKL